MFRWLLYLAAGFFLWQIVQYALRLFIQSSASQEKVSGSQKRTSRRVDVIEEAEYQEIESKPKTPTH